MAAPSFVGAGAGVVNVGTTATACNLTGVTVAVGDLVVLQALQDGVLATAPTLSAISGVANLAGTANAMTSIGASNVGTGPAAKQHLWIGRATAATVTVSLAPVGGDDYYYRLYCFRGVDTGTALTDILENGTAGSITNGVGLATTITDTAITTLGADRLALQFVAVDDDNPVGPFTGTTGGAWTEPVAEWASATGTDGCIQLQIGWPTLLEYLFRNTFQNLGTVLAQRQAQQFTAPVTGTLGTVLVKLFKQAGTPTDDLTVEIQTDSGADQPSGTTIGTVATIPNSAIPSGASDNPLVAAVAAPVTSGTKYWIVAKRTGAASDTNTFGWTAATAPLYTSHRRGSWNGSNWITSLTNTMSFALVDPDGGTIDGGSYTMADADSWGVIGLALKPVPTVAGTAWEQPVDDTLSLADAATPESGKGVSIPDTLAVADSIAFQAVYARTLPDTLTVADAVAFQRDVNQAIPDTLSLADLLAAQRGIAQPLADTLNLADLLATATGKGVSIGDTLVLADALAFGRAQTLADTLTLADSLSSAGVYQRALADTLALSDSLTSVAAFLRTVADTLALADSASPNEVEGGVDYSRPIADTLALTDLVAPVKGAVAWSRPIADTLALSDSLTRQLALQRTLTDTLTVVDALRFARTLTLADTLELADTLASQAALVRALADTLALADSIAAERGLAQALADTLALADSLAAGIGRGVTLEDVLALADALTFLHTVPVGGAPRPTGRIDFPGIGVITKPVRGPREGAGRGRIDTSQLGVLARTKRGVPT